MRKVLHTRCVTIADQVNIAEDWEVKLGKMLREHNSSFGAVIDSGGGQILTRISKLMKPGGKIICYGMYVRTEVT